MCHSTPPLPHHRTPTAVPPPTAIAQLFEVSATLAIPSQRASNFSTFQSLSVPHVYVVGAVRNVCCLKC